MDVDALPDGTPFMVMEHLDGGDLSSVRKSGRGLPVAQAVGYVLEACEAIGEAHGLGIVHRDIKPANLFLAIRSNGRTRVKVLDFGISKLAPGQGDSEASP
jgi:eukaryotic-like serine/threonine-protein kinase